MSSSTGKDLWRVDGPLTADTLSSLSGINQVAIESLSLRAADPGGEPLPAMPLALRSSWASLCDARTRRLARCPYLLVDMRFGDAARWQAALNPASVIPGGAAPLVGRRPPARSEDRDVPELASAWFGDGAPRVARLALTFAWHLAQTQRLAARITLGMSDDTAKAIAGLCVHELEHRLLTVTDWLRPRWVARVGVWRHFLDASLASDDARLVRAQLRGLQLLAAEVREVDIRAVTPRPPVLL